MNRGLKAKEFFEHGYNCTQSVAAAFSDLLPVDFETLLKLASPFGGGMGRLREVCGAVSGMFLVLGFLEGYDNGTDDKKKKELYTSVQKLANSFKEENTSFICRELLGLSANNDSPSPEKRTPDYYKKRPCAELCESAANILQAYLENK